MRLFRKVMVAALASGIAAFLLVPLLFPFQSNGTLTNVQAAGSSGQFIKINEISIHYKLEPFSGKELSAASKDVSGVKRPPVIILLHGFGASTFSWRDVMVPLSKAGDVIAYDRPAFGFTERPKTWTGTNPYGFEGNLEILQALVEKFASKRNVILVGHSAGGLIAAEFARLHPDLVQKLVLVAPAVLNTGGASGLGFLKAIPQIDALGPLLVQGIATTGNALLEKSFYDKKQLTQSVVVGYRAPLRVIGWERGFWEFTNAPRENAFLKNVETLRQSTLLISGEFDTVVPTTDTKKLSNLIPDNSLVIIPKTAHLPHEENPKLFNQAVLGWLGR